MTRKTMFVGTALFAIYLACSGGSPRSTTPPPPPPQDNSLRDVFLRLGTKMCSLRETDSSHWVINFEKGVPVKDFEVQWVGSDFVRLTRNGFRFDLPFSSIVLVTSDD